MFPTTYRQFPNQRIIKTQKEPSNKENLYSIVNIQALQNAIKVLDERALLLWLYLNKNQNNYMYGLSVVDIVNNWELYSEATYRRAFKDLVEKGFLEQVDNDDYIFYEYPQRYKNSSQQ